MTIQRGQKKEIRQDGKVRAIFPEVKGQQMPPERPVLITGGAGFIGTNLADRLLSSGRTVLILDNLSRAGVEKNAAWLREKHGNRVQIEVADIRDRATLHRCIQRAEQVFHFAAQVAVTTSIVHPREDFEINVLGTLDLLDELRAMNNPPPLVFTSTNKVYGCLEDIHLHMNGTRYMPACPETGSNGIGEGRPLDFHSPYGCSKGSADQYVIDYARTYGIPSVVFRMSCIYGPHQFGTEDQGWVAHFLIRAMNDHTITLFGDGKQVRDILFVEDLVDAFLLAQEHMRTISGQAFNIGGGPRSTTSLLELISLIHLLSGKAPRVQFDGWRIGDQRYYVSDFRKFQAATGWAPRVGVAEGVEKLYRWLVQSRDVPRVEYAEPLAERV